MHSNRYKISDNIKAQDTKLQIKLRIRRFAETAGAVLLALLFWQLAAAHINSSILIASPAAVFKRLLTLWREPDFFAAAAFTMSRIALGYLSAVVSALLLAFCSSELRLIEILLKPYIVCFRSVPVASMIVMLLIWVSAANISVIITFLVVFPVVYTNVLAGLKARDKGLLEMSSVFRISPIKSFRFITLPQLAPYIISSCSVTAGMAWKAGAAAEVIGTPARSIGKMIYQSKAWLNTEDLFAWTLVLVLLSVITEKLFIYALKRLAAVLCKNTSS